MFRTKYCGPTNSNFARVRVEDCYTHQRMYVPWNDALDVEGNHTEAFKAFLARSKYYPWDATWVRIPMNDGNYYIMKSILRDVE